MTSAINARHKCTPIISIYQTKPLVQNEPGYQFVLRNVSSTHAAWDLKIEIIEPSGNSFRVEDFYVIATPSWWHIHDKGNHGIFILPKDVVRFGLKISLDLTSKIQITYRTDENATVATDGTWRYQIDLLPVVEERKAP